MCTPQAKIWAEGLNLRIIRDEELFGPKENAFLGSGGYGECEIRQLRRPAGGPPIAVVLKVPLGSNADVTVREATTLNRLQSHRMSPDLIGIMYTKAGVAIVMSAGPKITMGDTLKSLREETKALAAVFNCKLRARASKVFTLQNRKREKQKQSRLLDAAARRPAGFRRVMATRLFEAIVELHSMGVVHRDLKPNNILSGLDELKYPTIMLIDFGTAGVPGSLPSHGQTPKFRCPSKMRQLIQHVMPVEDWISFLVLLGLLIGWDLLSLNLGDMFLINKDLAENQCLELLSKVKDPCVCPTVDELELRRFPQMPENFAPLKELRSRYPGRTESRNQRVYAAYQMVAALIVQEFFRSVHSRWSIPPAQFHEDLRTMVTYCFDHDDSKLLHSTFDTDLATMKKRVCTTPLCNPFPHSWAAPDPAKTDLFRAQGAHKLKRLRVCKTYGHRTQACAHGKFKDQIQKDKKRLARENALSVACLERQCQLI
jgi:serine/threonine protein kinase